MKFKFGHPEVNDMTENTVDIRSTSANTADASPIVMAQTDLLRLKFIPKLVNNEKDSQKSVSGKIIFEKKKRTEANYPSENDAISTDDRVSKRSVKVGDWLELNLDTSETFALYSGLKQLYDVYRDMDKSFPYGFASYARIDSKYKDFLAILQNEPCAAQMIGDSENYELVKILLQLITNSESHESLKKSLSQLQDNNLQNLTTSINIEKLMRVASLMRDNFDNDSEEFWQSVVFKENQWILGQIFACPFTIFEDKAYLGGKSINNIGGSVCDYLYKNKLSQNVALIEIKNPCADIIGKQYRRTYSISSELSGAINQVLNYKDDLLKNFYSLANQSDSDFSAFSPKCVVVIGKLSSLDSKQKISAFENYRNSFNNVIIITFDELYERISDLISLLSENDSMNKEISF
ncbi:MAG: Shedu immune nuclease family protein [Ruminococcus flavefaciens]